MEYEIFAFLECYAA